MLEINPVAIITGRHCTCRSETGKRCGKCRARGLWYRRKSWRIRKSPARDRIGKK
jgi:hypothetical protein